MSSPRRMPLSAAPPARLRARRARTRHRYPGHARRLDGHRRESYLRSRGGGPRFRPRAVTHFTRMHEVYLRHRFRIARSRLRVRAVNRAVHAFARARFALPDASPARFHITVQRDLRYRATLRSGAHARRLHPDARSEAAPTILYVHGGGFAMLSKETHRVMALSYARRGYLVFSSTTASARSTSSPRRSRTRAEALLWVRDNCAYFGGDPSRLAIAGESAGGNLVTALAVASALRRPEPFAQRLFDADVKLRAVVATYGFLDLESIEHYERHPRLRPRLKDDGPPRRRARTWPGRSRRRGGGADGEPAPRPRARGEARPAAATVLRRRRDARSAARATRAASKRPSSATGGRATCISRRARFTATTQWSGASPLARSGGACTTFSGLTCGRSDRVERYGEPCKGWSVSASLISSVVTQGIRVTVRRPTSPSSPRRAPEALCVRIHGEDQERGVAGGAAAHSSLDHHRRQRQGGGGARSRRHRAAAAPQAGRGVRVHERLRLCRRRAARCAAPTRCSAPTAACSTR